MEQQKLHIRGSSSAFCQGTEVLTKWGTGCYRMQVINSYGIKTSFPETLAVIGAKNEELYALKLDILGVTYIREQNVNKDLINGVIFTGRMDFWCPQESVKIRELKSMTSKTAYKEVFKKEQCKNENLAQLISYMVCMKEERGLLIYTFYEDTKNLEESETKEFLVCIEENGHIRVNDKDCGFTIDDQLRHQYASAFLFNGSHSE